MNIVTHIEEKHFQCTERWIFCPESDEHIGTADPNTKKQIQIILIILDNVPGVHIVHIVQCLHYDLNTVQSKTTIQMDQKLRPVREAGSDAPSNKRSRIRSSVQSEKPDQSRLPASQKPPQSEPSVSSWKSIKPSAYRLF